VHKPDEFIDVAELVNQVRIYALTTLALCGARGPSS
jgi:hypothetical protein